MNPREQNAPVLKTVCPKGTGVRIPLPAPIKMVYSLRVDLFLLPQSEALESALRANSRGEGVAFERKPSGSLLTSGGAINLRVANTPPIVLSVGFFRPFIYFHSRSVTNTAPQGARVQLCVGRTRHITLDTASV